MDVLADVLSVTRIGTTEVTRAELAPPWGLRVDPRVEAHVHVVVRGRAWLRTDATEPLELRQGDVALLGPGVAHAVSDAPTTPAAPHEAVLRDMPRRVAALPPDRAPDVVLCARYRFEPAELHPLAAVLPPLLHLPAGSADDGLRLLLELLGREATEPGAGSDLVVPRLVDSLLVYTVRAWLAERPVQAGDWFAALSDPGIGRALRCIHAEPATAWTVDRLAGVGGQSRAAFARRFARLVGQSPIAYLTRWRMCVATRLLTASEASLDEVAERVGYETAAAFSKAFRRTLGTAPGQYRSARRSRAT